MIDRAGYQNRISTALDRSRIVALIGPRQCGKTTLARLFVSADSSRYFDLENPLHLAQLTEPMTTLGPLEGLVVIDEIQRSPDLFPVLRVLADRVPLKAKFLILGSASPELLKQSSESLAGRIEIVQIEGFSLAEIGIKDMSKHWLRGGFPLSYLASNDENSMAWRKNFVQTVIERDLPLHGVTASPVALYRFWAMLAHYHGQIWSAVEPAQSLGVSQPTVRKYLDILTGLFMIRQLQPLQVNLGKRQVKSPKIYFRDTGVLHHMLGANSTASMYNHPKSGASWEGYVIEEIIKTVLPDYAYFWATQNGAEIDLVLEMGGKRYGVECKRADVPKVTPSMKIALEDLTLEKIAVVYPGNRKYVMADKITAIPVECVAGGMAEIFGP